MTDWSRMVRNSLSLYLVTDEKENLLERTEAALRGGVTCVQLRAKTAGSRRFLEEARAMKALCNRYGIPFVVNDRADIARLSGADMLHIGQSDLPLPEARRITGPDMPIGVSAKTVEEAQRAEAEGAAYLGVGSVFPTASKPDAERVAPETVRSIRHAASLPIVLIGGINENNLSEAEPLISDGIAVVSGILSAPNPQQTAASLRSRVDRLVRLSSQLR
ncbi:thiamine phosphate synthase [Salinithrix halophila]|uniref:Thiamine-phosphate synthase n=1 Tax=Salinithrix halophila TaxID=1485204 RepID=A0ABV8JHZ9_9BACL